MLHWLNMVKLFFSKALAGCNPRFVKITERLFYGHGRIAHIHYSYLSSRFSAVFFLIMRREINWRWCVPASLHRNMLYIQTRLARCEQHQKRFRLGDLFRPVFPLACCSRRLPLRRLRKRTDVESHASRMQSGENVEETLAVAVEQRDGSSGKKAHSRVFHEKWEKVFELPAKCLILNARGVCIRCFSRLLFNVVLQNSRF